MKYFVMVLALFMMGCTINMAPSKQIQSHRAATEVAQVDVPWPHEMKEYWYARYFLTMALNPKVQLVLKPEQVFDVVKCTVDGFEKDYEYERFVKVIGANMKLQPQIHKYIYDLSFECSLEVKRKAAEDQSKKPLTLEQSI